MDDIFEIHSTFCHVFTDPKRLRIMWALRDGEKTVGELTELLGTSMSNTSQHLRLMKAQGVLAARKDGRSVLYRITNPNFIRGCLHIRKGILEQLALRGEASDSQIMEIEAAIQDLRSP